MEESLIQLSYSVDTLYFLVMGALVMFMAPGFAMLEAGMVRAKNTSEILTKNVALFAIASLMYLIVGYSIMYSDGSGWIPGIGTYLGGGDNSVSEVLASEGDVYYSSASDFFFQVVFVATAMSIISGAVAERMKLFAFLAFAVVMTGFIYPVQGFWKWGGGPLQEAGFLDFAGSGVVHMCGAAAALAGVLLLGARKGKYGPNGQVNPLPGANMPLATLGMFILWFGWFGFNGGSALAAGQGAAMALLVTHISAAVASLVWMFIEWRKFGRPSVVGMVTGMVAGLATVTPASGFIGVPGGIILGLAGGYVCYVAVDFIRGKLQIDDSLDVFAVHGVGGVLGSLLVAVLATETFSGAGLGEGVTISSQLGVQAASIGITVLWTAIASYIIFKIAAVCGGLRVDSDAETEGLDLTQHGERGYHNS